MQFKLSKSNFPTFNMYRTSLNSLYLSENDGNVLEGMIMKLFFEDVTGLKISNKTDVVIGVNSRRGTSQIASSFAEGIVRVDKYCEVFNESRKQVICSDYLPNHIRENVYTLSLNDYSISKLEGLSNFEIGIRSKFYSFNNYLVVYRGPNSKERNHLFYIYDLEQNSFVEIKEQLSFLINDDKLGGKKLVPIYAQDGILYTAHSNTDNPEVPPSIIKIDINEKSVKGYLDVKSFTDEPGGYDPITRRFKYGFRPMNFTYDETSNQLIALMGSGFFSYDLSSEECKVNLVEEEFKSHDISAEGKTTLFGDHLYFSSFRAKNPSWDWSLAAFNIRTQKVDWTYDFPVELHTNGISAPQVNKNYLITHDSNKNLYLFEKMKN